MTTSELVSRFLILQNILHLKTHNFPRRTQITTLCIVKLLMCLPQENDPKFRAFAKHLCLLREQYSVEWVGKCKLGISVKYLFCQMTIANHPLSPRSCEDGFLSASGWEFKAAAQIDKFLFSCTEKIPKSADIVNTSTTETFSQNNLELEKEVRTKSYINV